MVDRFNKWSTWILDWDIDPDQYQFDKNKKKKKKEFEFWGVKIHFSPGLI